MIDFTARTIARLQARIRRVEQRPSASAPMYACPIHGDRRRDACCCEYARYLYGGPVT